MQRIKTNIKFCQIDNCKQRLCGFVTKINGSWRGCRDTDECKKKIVLLDEEVAKEVVPGALYRCSLVPMRDDCGFIAMSASIVRFNATIDTDAKGLYFTVKVRFGNKCIIYDPGSPDKRKRDITAIANRLRLRFDLINPMEVAENFINSACLVRHLYETHKLALKCL